LGKEDSCNEISHNIFFYNSLSDAEKEKINKHIVQCSPCKTLFDRIQYINSLLTMHIDEDSLASYTLLKEKNEQFYLDEKKLSLAEIAHIEKHVAHCRVCKEKYNQLQSQYADMLKFWQDSDYTDFDIQPLSRLVNEADKKAHFKIQKNKKYVYPLLAAAAVILILLLTLNKQQDIPSFENWPDNDNVEMPLSIRGAVADQLQQGISHLNQADYPEAILDFRDYINSEADAISKNYARYLLGLTYFKSATQNNEINRTHIDKSMTELHQVASETRNIAIQEDAFWYLAQASLLKNDLPHAVRYFEKVRLLNGSRAKESEKMLQRLKENAHSIDSD